MRDERDTTHEIAEYLRAGGRIRRIGPSCARYSRSEMDSLLVGEDLPSHWRMAPDQHCGRMLPVRHDSGLPRTEE